jgi:uncharacterized membrane protein
VWVVCVLISSGDLWFLGWVILFLCGVILLCVVICTYFNISYYVCTFFAVAKKDTKESTSPAHRSAGAAELYAVDAVDRNFGSIR